MTQDERERDIVLALDKIYKAITGSDAFLYASNPTGGIGEHIVFTDTVIKDGYAAARWHMESLVNEARAKYQRENAPIDFEATRQIAVWIINDGDFYPTAREMAERSVDDLQEYLTEILKAPMPRSAPWQVRAEISDNVLANRIDWTEALYDLLSE